MQNIFSLISAAFFAPAFRYVTLFLLSAAALPICGMEEEGFVSSFKQFTFQEKRHSFNDLTNSSEHQKACTLLYVFRNDVNTSSKLLDMITKSCISGIEEVNPKKGFKKAFKISAAQKSLYFVNLNESQWQDYVYYSDFRRSQELVKVLKGEVHRDSNKLKSGRKAPGNQFSFFASSFTTGKSFVSRISQRFFSGILHFITEEPFVSVGLLFGGFLLYRAKYQSGARVS